MDSCALRSERWQRPLNALYNITTFASSYNMTWKTLTPITAPPSNGNTFTFAEMSQWLREAGFKNPRALDVQSHSPLILATKP